MKEGKHQVTFSLDTNAIKDDGEGHIKFTKPLVITDDTVQRNGTKYDIASMDISEYKGQLTANHSSRIEEIIGRVDSVRKVKNKVVIDGIDFAINENALARYAYNMLRNGYLTDFSIETYGPCPDEEGVYKDAKLVGLSVVVVGNNKSAAINDLAISTIEEAKKDGLDTSIVENNFVCYDKNDGKSTPSINNKENDMPKAEEKAQEKEVKEAKAENTAEKTEDKKVEKEDNALEESLKVMSEKLEKIEKQMFNQSAKEPEFKKAPASNGVKNELSDIHWRERHAQQINHAWNWLKQGSEADHKKLMDINEFHLESLKKKGLVQNAVSLEDFGNFVISEEMITEIQGHRSNYQPFLSRLDWRETLSLQMAWLKRSGDIDMQEVEMCDDDADGNLKPISDYSAGIETADLHELAAVTPVCNAATRFLAADLLGDVAAGYRTDYDRKRAELVIARFQQAVDSTGNTITYTTDTDANALEAFINTWSLAAEEIMNGTFIFSAASYGELVRRLVGAGINGPLGNVFTTGDQPMILGRPYIIVPNDLMPPLNTAETRTHTVEGVNVSITQGVFYADLSTFTGRTSGGLQYDLSTDAAYEEDGIVKSAFQRNELVLRGSFFRNGAVKDEDLVVGLGSPGVS